MILGSIVLVYFAMPPEVGYNRKMTTAALYFASKCYQMLVESNTMRSRKHTLLASVAVHVCLERAGASEALIADLALVLLLRA